LAIAGITIEEIYCWVGVVPVNLVENVMESYKSSVKYSKVKVTLRFPDMSSNAHTIIYAVSGSRPV